MAARLARAGYEVIVDDLDSTLAAAVAPRVQVRRHRPEPCKLGRYSNELAKNAGTDLPMTVATGAFTMAIERYGKDAGELYGARRI